MNVGINLSPALVKRNIKCYELQILIKHKHIHFVVFICGIVCNVYELSERTFIFPFNEITLELNSNTNYVNKENDEMRSYKDTLYNQDFVLRN